MKRKILIDVLIRDPLKYISIWSFHAKVLGSIFIPHRVIYGWQKSNSDVIKKQSIDCFNITLREGGNRLNLERT